MNYSETFEAARRISPRIWDVDYCLLIGLKKVMMKFCTDHVTSHSKIIDFGCGAKPYRNLFPKSCTYIGVDACESPYADCIVKEDGSVPLPSGSCDLIISTQVIYLVADFSSYLKECKRLLKKDGKMLITTHGNWTYHPASGGDYYRFTQDGLRLILDDAGFVIEEMGPIVGTLGQGLHIRQLVFNHWLRKIRCGWLASIMNCFSNLRILFEDSLTPLGTRMSAPVIFHAVAKREDV